MSIKSLPDAPLGGGEIASGFRDRGCADFREAAVHISDLPYGRNVGRPAFLHVLPEGRGTCSGKHALVAALARESRLPVSLMVGIYPMDDYNTPGVGAVLAEAGLASIPEAHCWIEHRGTPIDLTGPDAQALFGRRRFVHVEEIAPEQAEGYKTALHRRFMEGIGVGGMDPWRVREACIAALSGEVPPEAGTTRPVDSAPSP